jgi:cytosol alanyl aminopeptidase
VTLACDGTATPALDLTQERYRPLGSPAAADTLWQVPVCVRYPTGAEGTAVSCTLLTGATGQMSLGEIGSCPAWILPNAGGVGYYRSRLAGTLQAKLVAALDRLTIAERVAVIDDARALVAAGHLSPAAGLDLVRALAGDPSPLVVAAAVHLVKDVDAIAPAEVAPALGAWVREVFGARAAKLGWTPAAGDDDARIEVRKELVPLVADLGRDPDLGAGAMRLARAWIDDPAAIHPTLAGEALRVAARSGDAALFDELLAAAPAARSRHDRELLHEALGAFRDPALTARALDVVLDAGVDIRESLDILWSARHYRESRAATLAFVGEHADTLLARMPVEAGARLARVVGALCDPELAEPAGDLLARLRPIPSGERATAQALERFELCSARRAAQAAALARYLER